MKSSPDPLLSVTRSSVQNKILSYLIINPKEISITKLATKLELPRKTVSDEITRLVSSSIINVTTEGNSKLVAMNESNPIYKPLSNLYQISYGPVEVLKSNVDDIIKDYPNIKNIYVYGSWARRYSGEYGPPPGDLDILFIGNLMISERHNIIQDIYRKLPLLNGFELNATTISLDIWDDQNKHNVFIKDLLRKPLVKIL